MLAFSKRNQTTDTEGGSVATFGLQLVHCGGVHWWIWFSRVWGRYESEQGREGAANVLYGMAIIPIPQLHLTILNAAASLERPSLFAGISYSSWEGERVGDGD